MPSDDAPWGFGSPPGHPANHPTGPSLPGGSTHQVPPEGGSAGVHAELAEMQRLHPLTLIHRVILSLPALLLALLPAIRNPDASSWLYIGMLLLYGIFVIPLLVVQYLRFRYQVSEKEIVIHSGVFTYQHRNIPIERIQNIEIEQKPLSRLLGTAKVKIETAGSASAEGVIEYVALPKAHAIREAVRAHQEARRRRSDDRRTEALRDADHVDSANAASASTDAAASLRAAATEADTQPRLLHQMTLGRVLLSGVFRFSLLYLVVIFSATEYLGFEPEDVARWIGGERFNAFVTAMEREPVVVIAATAFMILILAWITGIVTNLNRFYGFRLTLEGDKLHIRQGLLTVSDATIPLRRIQAFLVRSNPLMEAFGWYRLELQTIGLDAAERGNQVAAPFARREEILDIARAIRPIEEPSDLLPVSRLMIRRTFVRYAVGLAVLCGAAAFLWPQALWGLTALPLLLVIAVMQYRRHGYETTREFLFVRRGVFRRTLWIVPVERFQVFYSTQSLFQRRLGLRSVFVDTPGAPVIAPAVIVDLPDAVGSRLVLDLYRAFQDRLESRSARAV